MRQETENKKEVSLVIYIYIFIFLLKTLVSITRNNPRFNFAHNLSIGILTKHFNRNVSTIGVS